MGLAWTPNLVSLSCVLPAPLPAWFSDNSLCRPAAGPNCPSCFASPITGVCLVGSPILARLNQFLASCQIFILRCRPQAGGELSPVLVENGGMPKVTELQV